MAQDPQNPYANNIGIYLNEAATGSCGQIDEDVIFTVFVILNKLSYPEVWGWEAKFSFENILFMGDLVFGDHVNVGTRDGEYIVGLATPLYAVNRSVIVAELTLMVSGYFNDVTQPSNVYIDGIYFSLLPSGQPAYLEASGSTGVSLYQAIEGPQLSMNCDCAPVGTENSSWGNLKSLYR
ncbi:MAG: hypothetical protein KAH56_07570 [Candidatus Krumholzibacteria bacterium]|nr:hypothetical protein [Candidatus Krumholzibacteria bacterium]